jgi:hypothetical protein
MMPVTDLAVIAAVVVAPAREAGLAAQANTKRTAAVATAAVGAAVVIVVAGTSRAAPVPAAADASICHTHFKVKDAGQDAHGCRQPALEKGSSA